MTTTTAEIRATLSGGAWCPDDAEFGPACRGFNLATEHRPDLVVQPINTADVAAAVRWAAAHDHHVAVHATGHGSGIPAADGVLINTGAMQSVSIDAERCTATVAAGVRWQDVINAAAPHGLAPLCGSSTDVGVVGYTLGGGMGPLARTFGFAADHVRSIEVVTATGETVTTSESSEPELFWALRGGKPAIGIATSMEFDLMPVRNYYGGGLFYAAADVERVLRTYAEWAPTLPESVTSSIAILRLPDLPTIPPPLRGTVSANLRFVHVGEAARGAELVTPMRAIAPPLMDTIAVTPFTQIASVHADPVDPMPARDDSLLLTDLPAAAVDAILGVAGPDIAVPLIVAEVRHMGGALTREAAVSNAVGGRDAAFNFMTIGPYPPPLQAPVDAAAHACRQAMLPWATHPQGASLINFQGWATDPEVVRRAWPDAMSARLETVSQRWNPDGVFRFGYTGGAANSAQGADGADVAQGSVAGLDLA